MNNAIKNLVVLTTLSSINLLANNLLEVELENNISRDKPLHINMTLTNISDKTIQINESSFPFNTLDITRDMFKVIEDGEEINYKGVMISGSPVYKTLSAGESHTTQIPLSQFYTTHKGTHTYDISYSDNVEIKKEGKLSKISLSSNHIEFESTVEENEQPKLANTSCYSSALTTYNNDFYRARIAAQKSIDILQQEGYNGSLYKKYFYTYDADSLHRVYINFKNIYASTFQSVQPVCQTASSEYCSGPKYGNTVAYVFQNRVQNKEINLCPRYWNFDNNTKAGYLVHELSHFRDVANTIDSNAVPINNAYSYGYYATNILSSSSGEGTNNNTNTSNSSPLYFNFNSRSNTEGWQAGNLNDPYAGPYNGAWFFQASYNDPQIYSPKLNIDANVIKKITIRMANDSNPAQFNRLQVFWKGSGQGFSEANSQSIAVHNHGGWVTYTIDLSRNPRWGGNIEQIRIDPILAGDGHWIAIDYIALTK